MITVLLRDWTYFDKMTVVFEKFFREKPPARSTITGERWPQGALAMTAITIIKAT